MRKLTQDELQHYGVLGMKWGRRKARSISNPSSFRRSTKIHEDYRNAHKRKSVKEMSDNELRQRINRLNMESQYSKMRPSKVKKGQKFVKKIIGAGTTIATITTTGLTIYNNIDKINKILNKK